MNLPPYRQVLECASTLALSDLVRRRKSGRGLPQSKTLARLRPPPRGSWFQSMRKIGSWMLDVLLMFGFGCTGLRNFPISGGIIASMRAKTLGEALSSQYPNSFFLCSAEGSGSFFFVIASWPASLSRRDSAASNSVLAWYSAGNDASA